MFSKYPFKSLPSLATNFEFVSFFNLKNELMND